MFSNNITIISASLADYLTIQNMARFYVYDLSRSCGFTSNEYDWALPKDGLYESNDFKNYFTATDRKAYLVKVNNELAGFVLLNKVGTSAKTEWNMGEFFIIARFQGKGVGYQVAWQIWQMYPANWEISVIPENKPALAFWRKAINEFTKDNYLEEIKLVKYEGYEAERIIFAFDTRRQSNT